MAGVWDRVMDALTAEQEAAGQMIDTSMSGCASMELFRT
jgi:hypothetical protein